MQFSQRLQLLQSNVFADMDRAKAKALATQRDLIDLSLGSSDLPVADRILDRIRDSISDTSTHG